MSEKIKGAIFDLDGTLVDSLTGIAEALNGVLEERGYGVLSEQKVRAFIGDGLAELVKLSLPGEALQSERLIVEAGFRKYYARRWKGGTRIYPGVERMLHELAERDFPIAVLSNKPHEFTVEMVKFFFPGISFSVIQGHGDDFPKKPAPQSAWKIAEDWGLLSEEIAYVGDSDVDLATAHNAGMFPAIVSWGYNTPNRTPEVELFYSAQSLTCFFRGELKNGD